MALWDPRSAAIDVVIATLTDDDGEEAGRWAKLTCEVRARVAGADAPRSANLRTAENIFKADGFVWHESDAIATKPAGSPRAGGRSSTP